MRTGFRPGEKTVLEWHGYSLTYDLVGEVAIKELQPGLWKVIDSDWKAYIVRVNDIVEYLGYYSHPAPTVVLYD